MLGGDPNSIKQICAALAENPPMPVVVFEGSGKAADLLAYAVSLHIIILVFLWFFTNNVYHRTSEM